MAKLRDLIQTAEEAAEEIRAEQLEHGVLEDRHFNPTDPSLFPKAPSGAGRTERIRKQMRKQALEDHYFFCVVVLGYTKLRPEPHGELCRFIDFIESEREKGNYEGLNRTIIYMPRDHYKTTIATIARAIRRGCKDPNTRGLILSDTGLNAKRFGLEIGNHFKFNQMLQWLFPEVIPENFNTARWSANEMVLRRTAVWREPTFDIMGAGGGIESRHYDWIIPDDLVTETHIESEAEMDRLIKWIPSLEPLLVNDVISTIDFVGSRKKKGDAYEYVEKYFGAKDEPPVEIGPHCEKRGGIIVYSRSVRENGKLIFPFDPVLGSGVSEKYVERMKKHDPERYWAQLANSPKGEGMTLFNIADARFFKLDKDSMQIFAIHNGDLIEKLSVWSCQRIILFDPSVAESKRSSKNAIHVVCKGSGPNRYVLESHVGHYSPEHAIDLLFDLNERWRPDLISIEKRGFQGWVKYALAMIAELKNLPYLPIVEFPPEGSQHVNRSKPEHIKGLQPLVRNHLLWFQEDQHDLLEELEFYPAFKWNDGLDALAQAQEYWPFAMDEAVLAELKSSESRMLYDRTGVSLLTGDVEKERAAWSEEEFLASLDSTGYGFQ